MDNKNRIILITIIGVVAALAVIVILSLLILGPAKKTPPLPPVVQYSPAPKPKTPVIITYDDQKRDQLVDKIAGKKKLSLQDLQVKDKVLTSLNNKSGVVYNDPSYITVYLSAPDIFQVEISTTDYQRAKTDATEWFKAQGFSFDGICNLPIQFYLSAQTKFDLQNKDINFNPLPEGC